VFRRRIRIRIHCAVFAMLSVPASGWAQNASPSSDDHDQETINQLVQQIKQLQQQDRDLQERIKVLEARQIQTPPVTEANPASPATPPVPAEQTPPTPATPPLDWHEVRGIQWRGFGEFNYKVLDQRQPELGTYGFTPGSAGNFYTGDFDLFLASRISDKASVLSEIAFGEGDAQTFNVDLERFLLNYEFNDHLKMSFGRYQTGVSFYNSEFRSAKWLLTTADRPLVMEFTDAGGLLPTQAVGVSITGLVPSGKLGLNYLFEYGSSDAIRPDIDGSGNVDDESNSNHVLAGFFVRPDRIPGLRVGGSFYHDKISRTDETPVLRFDQTILSGHVVYLRHGIEFLNEGVLIRHHIEGSKIVFNQPAFYSQFSVQLSRIRPFFRYQYANMSEAGFFNDVGLRYGPSFGARYAFHDSIAFKLQFDHTVRDDKANLNGLQTQLVFTF
jgi:hypothetical protein